MMFGGGMILTTIVIIIGIIFLVRYLSDNNSPGVVHYENKTALQILKERYARGEINRDQFETMKRDLGE